MSEAPVSGEDRTLFGEGRYPETGIVAVTARLVFIGAVLAIVIAVFLPRSMVPEFAHSHYLEHFAAFYVAALFGLAAMPRMSLRRLGVVYVIFAVLLESTHLLARAPFGPLVDNWVADVGGVAAAIAPVVVERFRRRFPKPEPPAAAQR
jgi:hypothetical protein